jgi:acetyl-CoA acyltransferase
VWGCVSQVGEQTFDIARTAVLSAGWPESVPGTTVDRQCGSSQQACTSLPPGSISGQYDVAVAGGVEVMSRTPMGSTFTASPLGADYVARYGADFPNQGVGAEQIADTYGLSRTQLDEGRPALARARRGGTRRRALRGAARTGHDTRGVVRADEGIRTGSTLEGLAGLKPAFRPDGRITAANSSQISDGAAALLVMTSERARELGMTPVARVHTGRAGGGGPDADAPRAHAGDGQGAAALGLTVSRHRCLRGERGLRVRARSPWLADLGADDKTGQPQRRGDRPRPPARRLRRTLMTTLVHHMRDHGIRYGLQTMCEGGGQANATVLELL